MSTISYDITKKSRGVNDGFTQMLQETEDRFAGEGISILGEGFKEIITTEAFFNDYLARMTEGLTPEDTDNISVLISNTRSSMLTEAGLAGVSPVASLSVPILRKSFPRLAVAKGFPTEAVEHPKFKVTFLEPWIKDQSGHKRRLPEAAMTPDELVDSAHVNRVRVNGDDLAVADLTTVTSPAVVDGEGSTLMGINLVDGIGAWTVSSTRTAQLDADITLRSVRLSAALISAWNAQIDPNDDDTAAQGLLTDTTDVLVRDVSATGLSVRTPGRRDELRMDTRTNVLNCVVYVEHPGFADEYLQLGTFFLQFDREHGTVTGAFVNAESGYATSVVTSFSVDAYVSTEMNQYAEEVGFDIQDREIVIPTSPHLTAPLPTEYLTDLFRMYNVDGASKAIEIMSDTLAQRIDTEGFRFLAQTWAQSPMRYSTTFNASPLATYALSPSDWRREIRTVIDHQAALMLDDSRFRNGYFVLFGNSVDTNLIPDVQWQISGGETEEYGGVATNFSMGAVSSAHRYVILSTQNMPRGRMYLLYVPTVPDQATVKYYPYSFTVERNNGYRDPNTPNVPAIVMHRRHQFESYIPLISQITIVNNDGQLLAINASDSYRP